MGIQTKEKLKDWFKRGCYPTEEQFGDLIDSLRHENGVIGMGSVDGLMKALNGKYDKASGEALERLGRGSVGALREFEGEISAPLAGEGSLDYDDGGLMQGESCGIWFHREAKRFVERIDMGGGRFVYRTVGDESWQGKDAEGRIRPYVGCVYISRKAGMWVVNLWTGSGFVSYCREVWNPGAEDFSAARFSLRDEGMYDFVAWRAAGYFGGVTAQGVEYEASGERVAGLWLSDATDVDDEGVPTGFQRLWLVLPDDGGVVLLLKGDEGELPDSVLHVAVDGERVPEVMYGGLRLKWSGRGFASAGDAGVAAVGGAVAELRDAIERATGCELESLPAVYRGSLGKLYVKITYSALMALRDSSQLIPGCFYRITDYECSTTQEDTRSAGHRFDIIVRADGVDRLNEVASAMHHEGDEYFKDNKLEAWQIWYCLDNDADRFHWADAENGKGVVYRMIDEFKNDCPYDFKNIQFKRYKCSGINMDNAYLGIKALWYNKNTEKVANHPDHSTLYTIADENDFRWYYTFNGFDGGVGSSSMDLSVVKNITMWNANEFVPTQTPLKMPCFGNVIKPVELSIWDNTVSNGWVNWEPSEVRSTFYLNNIVLFNNAWIWWDEIIPGYEDKDPAEVGVIQGYTFEVNCVDNTVYSMPETSNITFGKNCFCNIVLSCNAVFGNNCHDIITSCSDYSVGNDCYNVTVIDSMSYGVSVFWANHFFKRVTIGSNVHDIRIVPGMTDEGKMLNHLIIHDDFHGQAGGNTILGGWKDEYLNAEAGLNVGLNRTGSICMWETADVAEISKLRTDIVGVSGGVVNVEPGRYYRFDDDVDSLVVNLPNVRSGESVSGIGLYFHTGASPAVTIANSSEREISYYAGFSIEPNTTYELNCLFNGEKWIVAYGVVE